MDKWTADGKVKLDGDVMSLPLLGRSFRLTGAIHVRGIVDGADVHGLLNKVKSLEQLHKMSAEHYGASLIVGEVGYECTEGFIGVPVEGGAQVAGSGLLKLGNN